MQHICMYNVHNYNTMKQNSKFKSQNEIKWKVFNLIHKIQLSWWLSNISMYFMFVYKIFYAS